LSHKLPENVVKYINQGMQDPTMETPFEGDKIFSKSRNIIIGSNVDALTAALKKAQSLGHEAMIISDKFEGEASSIAKFFVKLLLKLENKIHSKPICIIAGGESTVTLKGAGKGGRNQEMVLTFLNELGESQVKTDFVFLSASTDGGDGPTDVAGAYVSKELIQKARDKNLMSAEYLSKNDSFHFFQALDGAVKTGPTGTNVCDIHILICS
jgi:hydroxypyruvate reductase